jgi:hypothetical protein
MLTKAEHAQEPPKPVHIASRAGMLDNRSTLHSTIEGQGCLTIGQHYTVQ